MSELAIFGGDPVIDRPVPPFTGIGEDETRAVLEVMKSGVLSGFFGSPGPRFYGGPVVRELEASWCARYGVTHALSVNSATSGLLAAMAAIGIGPGDEVIVPPYTMSATVITPLFYGGIPVFVDIDPTTFCLDPREVEAAITPKTRAILAVDLFGNPAPLAELRRIADAHGLWLVEDSAQAPFAEENGRRCGTVGDIGIFSLNYHKHIHSGEGGVCVTDNDDLAERMAMVRNHGENVVDGRSADRLADMIGLNLRMTELCAAVAKAQLEKIDERVARCERVARRLSEGTRDLPGWTPPEERPGTRHNYYMWTARYDEAAVGVSRETFSRALAAEGFPHEVGYCQPLYMLPVFRKRIAVGREGFPFTLTNRVYEKGLCPVTERLHEKEVIQFQPPSWDVDDALAERLIEAVRKVHRHAGELARLERDAPARKP